MARAQGARIERVDETDFVWTHEAWLKKEDSDVIVFVQHEEGWAGFASMMGFLGEEPTLVARIYSKLQTVPAFNSIPNPLFPEWHLYETRDSDNVRVFILRVIHVHPTSMVDGEGHDDAFNWLYMYPMYSSIIKVLIDLGVKRSWMIAQDVLPMVENVGVLRTYDFVMQDHYKEEDWPEDITVTPGAWIWASIFASFNNFNPLCQSNMVILPRPTQFIDHQGIDLLIDWGVEIMNLTLEEKSLAKAIEGLEKLEAVISNETSYPIPNEWYGDEFGA
tara:strand:+ start:288 stop:1115 length:828 start_codon:yes stop_codon:yes gene_type:complete